MSSYDDSTTRRDWDDLEWDQATGGADHADPAVIYAVIPLSSGVSTAAQTTFRCQIVSVVNEETEGVALATQAQDRELLATNITATRPVLNTDVLLACLVGDRFVIAKY